MEANSKHNSKSAKKTDNINPHYAIAQARGVITDTVAQIMSNFGLPPSIMDGIICDVLSEVRKKEIYDLNYVHITEGAQTKETEDGEHNDVS